MSWTTAMLILGLDPGGLGQFGWCIAETNQPNRLKLLISGTSDHAAAALETALREFKGQVPLMAAGIDSPLFWVAAGDRRADQTVRNALKRLGARFADGTVQRVNSLRGACLVQGVMAARLLRRNFPTIRLTESHPKALLWLTKVANHRRQVSAVTMAHLADFIECDAQQRSDHERDAALSAVAAAAMLLQRPGWRDLARDEHDAFAPVGQVEYWMPIEDPAEPA